MPRGASSPAPRRSTGRSAANRPACALQVRLHRLVAEPDLRQRLVERLARDRPARLAVERDLRGAVDEVERDDVAFLDLAEGLHDRHQLVGLRLDGRELGLGVVVLEAVDQRADQLVAGQVAQQVHLHAPRSLGQHAREGVGLRRHVEAADVDLEDHAGPHTRAVQHELLPADARLVVELDPAHLGRRRHARAERERHRRNHGSQHRPLLLVRGCLAPPASRGPGSGIRPPRTPRRHPCPSPRTS